MSGTVAVGRIEQLSPPPDLDRVLLGRIEQSVIRQGKAIEDLKTKMRAYDEQYMRDMEQRHRDMSQAFQLMVEKMTVVTEVGYYARHKKGLSDQRRWETAASVVWALDQPDGWWALGSELTVKEWADRCVDAYRAYRLGTLT